MRVVRVVRVVRMVGMGCVAVAAVVSRLRTAITAALVASILVAAATRMVVAVVTKRGRPSIRPGVKSLGNGLLDAIGDYGRTCEEKQKEHAEPERREVFAS